MHKVVGGERERFTKEEVRKESMRKGKEGNL